MQKPMAGAATDPELQRVGMLTAQVFLAFFVALLLVARWAGSEHEFPAILLLLGAALIAVGRLVSWTLQRTADELRLRLAGAPETAGVVTSVETDWSSSERREFPLVQFAVGSESRVLRVARPRRGKRAGDAVRLRYDPRDVSWVVIDDGGLARIDRFLRVGPPLSTLVALTLMAAGAYGLLTR